MKGFRICLLAFGVFQVWAGCLYAQPRSSIYATWETGFTKLLENTHDMALPAWGPYSNKYNGISHVPAENNGIRFDVIVQPSLYLRNQTALANTQRESGYHPWQASSDLSYFSYRYELEWKDQVFCDVSFSSVDEKSRLIKAEFVNNTDKNRSLALNMFSTIVFPYSKRIKVSLPDQVKWKQAADYSSKTDSIIPFNYNLVYNGQLRGQINDENAVSHTAIVLGKKPGEKLLYQFSNDRSLSNGVIVFRYRTAGGGETGINVTVNGKRLAPFIVAGAKEYTFAAMDLEDVPAGDFNLVIETPGNTAVILDGFALVKKKELSVVKCTEEQLNEVPQQITTVLPNAAILKFDDITAFYGLVWSDVSADERVVLDDNPDIALSKFEQLVKTGNGHSGKSRITGNNKGWFKNVFSAPIILRPGQKASRYAFVVCGDNLAEVKTKLQLLNAKWNDAENICRHQQSLANDNQYNKAGQPYQFSQQLMAATTLTNLMYPTFMGNKYIKHTTPGKKWSSFYTWDAGFIGLGYAELNPGRSLETLNAYTMGAEEQSAFLEHGTPLPVQGYLFNELWNKTQNTEYLAYFYPRLKRYYQFLGGAEHSPTRKLKSNLIQTWDIFYNSGGWDDYCPQVFTHKEKLEKVIAPAINTAHQIRFAKLLKMAAWQLGYQEDIVQYNADISLYSQALQQHAWDKASGYYGYVKHDGDGNATGILKHSSGTNFNRGLDGCSPLIAGICTPEQQQSIVKHLFTKGELWSDQGITAIDQSAPYYDKDGYWNGRVWMAHQWFIWKTMLDLNEPEKAVQIAQTALEVWKRETDDTYNCWENFSIEAGNGGGWHQFGALSSPVLNWFSALYKPGTITYGYDVWPVSQTFSDDHNAFKGKFKLFAEGNKRTTAILLCLNDTYNYQASCNGRNIPVQKILDGLYAVTIHLEKNAEEIVTLELIQK
jgi:hypothetical protein